MHGRRRPRPEGHGDLRTRAGTADPSVGTDARGARHLRAGRQHRRQRVGREQPGRHRLRRRLQRGLPGAHDGRALPDARAGIPVRVVGRRLRRFRGLHRDHGRATPRDRDIQAGRRSTGRDRPTEQPDQRPGQGRRRVDFDSRLRLLLAGGTLARRGLRRPTAPRDRPGLPRRILPALPGRPFADPGRAGRAAQRRVPHAADPGLLQHLPPPRGHADRARIVHGDARRRRDRRGRHGRDPQLGGVLRDARRRDELRLHHRALPGSARPLTVVRRAGAVGRRVRRGRYAPAGRAAGAEEHRVPHAPAQGLVPGVPRPPAHRRRAQLLSQPLRRRRDRRDDPGRDPRLDRVRRAGRGLQRDDRLGRRHELRR